LTTSHFIASDWSTSGMKMMHFTNDHSGTLLTNENAN